MGPSRSALSRPYYGSLEGIRAYAFLIVFLVHCVGDRVLHAPKGEILVDGLKLLVQVSWLAVPIFFVLSGFLITGLLYDTRVRGRFFAVFFARRALRILPLYYLVLSVAALIGLLSGLRFRWAHLSFLLYLQNAVPNWKALYQVSDVLDISPLWSLAVEEQFYLLWPLCVWLVPGRKPLLKLCYGLILGSAAFRLLWPWLPFYIHGYQFSYESTLARGGALLMGSALALHRRAEGAAFLRTRPLAIGFVLFGLAILGQRLWATGETQPFTRYGLAVLTPAMDGISLGVVMLALEPHSVISRICQVPAAMWLGKMSYGLYLYHCFFVTFAFKVVEPRLAAAIGTPGSLVLVVSGTFAITCLTAWLSFRFLEFPMLRFKEHFRYGPEHGTEGATEARRFFQGRMRSVPESREVSGSS